MTPAAFMRQMSRLVKARRASDAAALYEQHGVAVAPRLSEWDRETLAALMEYVDTVIGWTPPADGLRASVVEAAGPGGRAPRGSPSANGLPQTAEGARVPGAGG